MNEGDLLNDFIKKLHRYLWMLFSCLVIAIGLFVIYMNPSFLDFNDPEPIAVAPVEEDDDPIVNGIHVRTGLIDDAGLMIVVNNCTNCHSSKLITQNRMNTEGWNTTIKWMQETQNLWDLGGNQEIIVNYLVKNYPPIAKGRRLVLSDIDWYELKD